MVKENLTYTKTSPRSSAFINIMQYAVIVCYYDLILLLLQNVPRYICNIYIPKNGMISWSWSRKWEQGNLSQFKVN